jgi:glycosyltransferase AglD
VLTLFIPAYNEETLIHANALVVARRLREVAATLAVDIGLVVLDDGSVDRTGDEVRRAAERDPTIGYLWAPGPSRRENLVRAMLDAPTPYVGWLDADLATSMDYLEDLVAACTRYDIVTGSRYLPSSHAIRTVHRRLISRGYNAVVQALFGSRIRDHWCGFKIFRRAALAEITNHIGIGIPDRQMFWDAQMWVCAQRLGMKVLELPVHWREGDKSALRVHTELPMVRYTMRYWASRRWTRITPTAAVSLPHPAAQRAGR